MLLRVILKNFLSFRDMVQFDMFPNPKRELCDGHVYYDYAAPVLKQAAIYGPNGAGKSNLVKGILFLKRFVTDRDFLSKEDFDRFPFALADDGVSQNMELAMEFMVSENQGYIYTVFLSERGVEEEGLYDSGVGKENNRMIFRRKGGNVEFSYKLQKDIGDLLERVVERNPRSSFMALNQEFPAVVDKDISKAFNWFKNSLVVIGTDSTVPMLINLLRSDDKLMGFTRDMMSNLCLGISGIDIVTEDADEWMSKHASELPESTLDNLKENEVLARMENERQSLAIFSEEGVKKIGRFIFSHLGPGGHVGRMDISAQSDGTVRLLTLLPAIYDAVRSDRTIVIDEIDYKMHPSLVVGLIEYFSHNEKTHGQLVFTTHETSLMEERHLLRHDEVWFADKRDGVTQLYSLNDFKLHHSMSVRNGYRDGRFRAIPKVGNLLSLMHRY